MSKQKRPPHATLDGCGPSPQMKATGYKRPPVNTRFQPGRSGNSKGRPKGRLSFANIVRDTLNASVPLRIDGKTRRVTSTEAIVRLGIARAPQDIDSLIVVMEFYEATGRTGDMTDEARAKRALHLPLAFSHEELDVLYAEARERDRQRCRMRGEWKKGTKSKASSDLRSGDEFASRGKIDDALAAYHRELARSKAELLDDDDNEQAQSDFRTAVSRIGLLADALLFAGDFVRAIQVVDEALAESATPLWVLPKNATGRRPDNVTWIAAIRAHARMFSGQVQDARTFYLRFQSDKRLIQTSWEIAILQDFARLRKVGQLHPLMDEIEKRFAEAGWTLQPGNKMTQKLTMKGEDQVFLETHRDDIEAGDLLERYGRPEDAAAVYVANLKKCLAKPKPSGNGTAWEANLQIAIGHVKRKAKEFLDAGRFALALECAEQALTGAPDKLELHAIRADALMFLGRDNDAVDVYRKYWGKMMVGGLAWEIAVLESFNAHRKAGRSRQLMDVVEKKFADGGEIAPAATEVIQSGSDNAVSTSILVQSSDIHSGEMLEHQGRFDEALVVYRRCLEDCTAKISRISTGQVNLRAIDDRTIVLEKITGLASQFLVDGHFAKALDVADSLIAVMPTSAPPILYRAHALMFLGREEEARSLYLRQERALILGDFATLRRAELTHPLMDEIESLLLKANNGENDVQ